MNNQLTICNNIDKNYGELSSLNTNSTHKEENEKNNELFYLILYQKNLLIFY